MKKEIPKKPLTPAQIEGLYDTYLNLIQEEVSLGFEPTALTHLIGRLGELYCAKELEVPLPLKTNQRGFDVKDKDGKQVSVKTTAQVSGFVAINPKTLKHVDRFMILQYSQGSIQIIYHGSKDILTNLKLEPNKHSGKYELNISLAKKYYEDTKALSLAA